MEVVPEVEAWLSVKASPWGIYLTSESSMRELQQHFRRYLWVRIPEQEKPVLMRFYDPRNIWVLVEVLTPASVFLYQSRQTAKYPLWWKNVVRIIFLPSVPQKL
ncbi:DUF4123 domain-containing protein [Escherichia coli]|nr:DUF4123 domain-containing protein [Escherichia coli]